MIELVVFDMAGTTIDAGEEVVVIFQATLANWSVPVTSDQITAVRGAGKRQAMADLLSRHAPERLRDLDEIDAAFRSALTTAADRFRLYPGADDAVTLVLGNGGYGEHGPHPQTRRHGVTEISETLQEAVSQPRSQCLARAGQRAEER